jgi:hypothetical protein
MSKKLHIYVAETFIIFLLPKWILKKNKITQHPSAKSEKHTTIFETSTIVKLPFAGEG